MAGQIIQRGERTWLLRVFQGRENGKRKYLNQTVHGTKKDAQRVMNSLLRDNDMGTLVEPTRSTVNEYLTRWMETAVQGRVREGTLASYDDILRLYVRPLLGRCLLAKITTLDIQ